jgi:hypothetical protein
MDVAHRVALVRIPARRASEGNAVGPSLARRVGVGPCTTQVFGATELGTRHVELEVPLRIFRVGIEALIRGDEKTLLNLVGVERKILQQALGLDGGG